MKKKEEVEVESIKYLLIEPCEKSVYLNSYFHNKEYCRSH